MNKRKIGFSIFKRQAFTLVEIILVVSLVAVISLAIFNAFSNGLKIWKIGNLSTSEDDIAIFFDKINAELQNTMAFSGISFSGKGNQVSFATIIRIPLRAKASPAKIQYADQIGKVEYYFDATKKEIYRREANYGQALQNKFSSDRPMVRHALSLSLQYYYTAKNEYTILKEANGAIPSAVLIEVGFGEEGKKNSLKRFFNVPIAN